LVSESEDLRFDTISDSKNNEADGDPTSPALEETPIIKVFDIDIGSDLGVTTRENFLSLCSDTGEFGDGGTNTPSIIRIYINSENKCRYSVL